MILIMIGASERMILGYWLFCSIPLTIVYARFVYAKRVIILRHLFTSQRAMIHQADTQKARLCPSLASETNDSSRTP